VAPAIRRRPGGVWTVAYFITEKCIGCTACARLCPVECITGERNQLHRIEPAVCVDCGACARVCPVDAIQDQFGVLQPHVKRSDWPKPVVVPEFCTGCNYCVDVCPENCLEVRADPALPGYGAGHAFGGVAVLVNPKACIGCRMCADVCAKNAIVMSDELDRLEREVPVRQGA
jgi:electron transport complex protein RnfB